jgi:hypothetical protein
MSLVWIFSEDDLSRELAAWVSAQKSTGHPKAIANADFIGAAIKDFLVTHDALYKKPEPKEEADDSGDTLIDSFHENISPEDFRALLKK